MKPVVMKSLLWAGPCASLCGANLPAQTAVMGTLDAPAALYKDAAMELVTAKGRSLFIKLRHEETAVDVTVAYSSFDGHPAIRKHLVLHNRGAMNLGITHLCCKTATQVWAWR